MEVDYIVLESQEEICFMEKKIFIYDCDLFFVFSKQSNSTFLMLAMCVRYLDVTHKV